MSRANPREDLQKLVEAAERALGVVAQFPSDFEEFAALQSLCDEIRETYFPETMPEEGAENG